MGLNSFIIKFYNNPNKIYAPGDTINGRVIIDLNSPKRINAIRIKYKGRSKTGWTQKHGKSSTHYSGKEEYFKNDEFIVQNHTPFELPTGKHTYEFSFVLPPVLPSSFNSLHGTVKYSVKVTMDRPWKFDQKVKNEFFVVQPIDLNQIEFVKTTATLTLEREYCFCFNPGKIIIKVYVPCSGFICGQTVPFKLLIDNASNLRINGLRIFLKKYIIVFTKNRKNKKILSEDLFGENLPLRVNNRSTESCFQNITIPSIPLYNLNNCEIIDIEYKLKFRFSLSGLHTDVSGKLPVMLGHIPLNHITPIEQINTGF